MDIIIKTYFIMLYKTTAKKMYFLNFRDYKCLFYIVMIKRSAYDQENAP